jgi:uncharacterized protein (TIGR01777 family)
MRIVIAGGSGQLGCILARHLHASDHGVVVLSRKLQRAPWRVVLWDSVTPGAWATELERSDVCINLAGRSVNCRYNAANRRAIYESRIRSTLLLNQVIGSMGQPPRLWVNASTATSYRHSLDRAMDEVSGELGGNEPGAQDTWKFSIHIAKAWEEAFFSTSTPRTRKIAARSAIVFSLERGGAFDVLLSLVRRGLGGAQGPSNQYVSWIHETDFVRAIGPLIARDDLAGAINLAAPNPLPNRDFMRCLRQAWGMRIGLPTPKWMLELGAIASQTETELVLKSRRVVPGRLLAAGIQFTFSGMANRRARWLAAGAQAAGRHHRVRGRYPAPDDR